MKKNSLRPDINSIRVFAAICFVIASFTALHAQWDHFPIFPELEGEQLKEEVINSYKLDNILLDQRDTLFARIDAENNRLSCIYTDYTIDLNVNIDPTQDAFAKGINTEHVYPKSKGSGDHSGEFDMHHLFPSREDVNNYRASKPFVEIPDAQTARWYYLDQLLNNIPSINIDEYSEANGDFFEPREEMKGNVARAMMYFYTMYQNRADAKDPNYFDGQVNTLCDWHFQDPVDEEEWNRTFLIANYQEDKPNPFVLDCSLAARLYCEELSEECRILPTEDFSGNTIEITYIPTAQVLRITNTSNDKFDLHVFNTLGQIVFSTTMGRSTRYLEEVSLSHLSVNKMYHAVLTSRENVKHISFYSH